MPESNNGPRGGATVSAALISGPPVPLPDPQTDPPPDRVVSRLATHADVEPAWLFATIAEHRDALSAPQRAVFDSVLDIASRTVNRTAAAPSVVDELAGLAREIGAGAGPVDPPGPRLRRVLSARTLHLLRELTLYRDDDGVEPVWPHAGMLILNPILGCSFGCAYCFRADEQQEHVDWFLNGRPTQVIDEPTVVERLGRHPLFVPGVTQLGLHTATTEPFLPQVRQSTFRLLEILDERGWGNDVMIITKYFLREKDVARLASFRSFQILLLLTYNAAPAQMETMGAGPEFRARRARSVELLRDHATIAAAHYYRPIVPGWNDSDERIADALTFGEPLGLSVIGGLKEIPHLPQIARERGLSLPIVSPGGGNQKHFPPELVDRILSIHARLGLTSTIVGDQSCGLTVLLSRRLGRAVPNVEAIRLYDAASARAPKCMGRCTDEQLAACARPPRPTAESVHGLLARMGIAADVAVSDTGVDLICAVEPTRSQLDSLTAHLRYAVFWRSPARGAEGSRPC